MAAPYGQARPGQPVDPLSLPMALLERMGTGLEEHFVIGTPCRCQRCRDIRRQFWRAVGHPELQEQGES